MIDRFDTPDEIFARQFLIENSIRAAEILSLDMRCEAGRFIAWKLDQHGIVASRIVIDGKYWREPTENEPFVEGLLVPVADAAGHDEITDIIAITDNGDVRSCTGETAAFGSLRPAPGWWNPDVYSGQLDIFSDGRKWLQRYIENARRMLRQDGASAAVAELIPPLGEFETLVLDPARLEWSIHSTRCVIPEGVTRIVCPDSIALAKFLERNVGRFLRHPPRVIVLQEIAA